MKTKHHIIFMMILSLIAVSSCSETSSSSNTATTSSQNISSGTELSLSYTLSVAVDAEDDDLDFTLNFPKTYTIPITNQDGHLTIAAVDFPTMVYRVCAADSPRYKCQVYTDAISLDLDLTFDACGRSTRDSACGSDSATFSGHLDDDGTLTLENIALRARIFEVAQDHNGYMAEESEEGLIDFDRLSLDFSTEQDSPVSGQNVTLVSTGTIPSDIDAYGGAHFTATLHGVFNSNPLGE